MDFTSAAFWAALGSIIWVNVILSGDNAVVIAMAARSLPAEQQKKAVFWGSAAAIVLRIILTLIAAEMMRLSYLKIIGGLLLLYIGIGLLSGDDDDGDAAHAGHGSLMNAVRTILVADLVMSLDNVLAVAAAAKGNVSLLVIGLALSIPLIIFGSTLLMKVMERFPVIIMLGASASFKTATSRPSASPKSAAASTPIQVGSMFAAVSTTPARTTAGIVMPIGPAPSNWLTTSATV